jgi:hypothetical protein
MSSSLVGILFNSTLANASSCAYPLIIGLNEFLKIGIREDVFGNVMTNASNGGLSLIRTSHKG